MLTAGHKKVLEASEMLEKVKGFREEATAVCIWLITGHESRGCSGEVSNFWRMTSARSWSCSWGGKFYLWGYNRPAFPVRLEYKFFGHRMMRDALVDSGFLEWLCWEISLNGLLVYKCLRLFVFRGREVGGLVSCTHCCGHSYLTSAGFPCW